MQNGSEAAWNAFGQTLTITLYKHNINKFDLTAATVAKQQVSEDLRHCMSRGNSQTEKQMFD